MSEALWSAFGAGTVFGLSGGFSPGPLLVLVISETMRHGVRAGIMVAITPLLTDLPVMVVAVVLLNQLSHFEMLLGGISLAGAMFLMRIGWLSLKTAGVMPAEANLEPHSLGTRMMTNYLNPSMYLFWFTVGAPFLMRSSWSDPWPALIFTFSFYISIVGAKSLVAFGVGRSSRLTEGIWYHRIMQLLGIFLIGFSFLFVKDGLGYFGLI
ncbi:MAG: LysE family transporter [SAR324 cluster bacterium]|nr:LysE family transporter [SAR324 cluster bacterium]MDP7137075.1 LysE family transporter [SAR324 cluster bacterium]MDP7335759.1 LysE family transporter [SAR324 cluster bacterium]MEE1577687.1 LysE family transporter [Deltaproteobacteria bacterium]